MSEEQAVRITAILAETETTAKSILSADFLAVRLDEKVGDLLANIRRSEHDPGSISYIYVTDDSNILMGVVDLRELGSGRRDETRSAT